LNWSGNCSASQEGKIKYYFKRSRQARFSYIFSKLIGILKGPVAFEDLSFPISYSITLFEKAVWHSTAHKSLCPRISAWKRICNVLSNIRKVFIECHGYILNIFLSPDHPL
jgi:hypothetical protein